MMKFWNSMEAPAALAMALVMALAIAVPTAFAQQQPPRQLTEQEMTMNVLAQQRNDAMNAVATLQARVAKLEQDLQAAKEAAAKPAEKK